MCQGPRPLAAVFRNSPKTKTLQCDQTIVQEARRVLRSSRACVLDRSTPALGPIDGLEPFLASWSEVLAY